MSPLAEPRDELAVLLDHRMQHARFGQRAAHSLTDSAVPHDDHVAREPARGGSLRQLGERVALTLERRRGARVSSEPARGRSTRPNSIGFSAIAISAPASNRLWPSAGIRCSPTPRLASL